MIIKIGVPSKGRLRKNVLKVFKNNNYNLISERGERDYFAKIKSKKNVEIIYLHAREIIERLSDNSLDIGFSGYDLLKETSTNIQKIKFKGIIISDDISMKALKFNLTKNAIKALDAGCNLILHCNGNIKEMRLLSKVIPKIDKFTQKKTEQFYKFLG